MIRQFRKETPPFSPPAVSFAKFLHQIPRSHRLEALKEINDEDPNSHFQFWLFGSDGQILFPRDSTSNPVDWKSIDLPEKIFEYKPINKEQGRHSFAIVQVDNEPSEYLVVKFLGRGNSTNIFLINSISLLIAAILGTSLSLFILFYSLKQKARLADSVILELQKGNLKARFPITKMDEVGETMLRFNKMADEIERLVERLKATEKSRMLLLQELAHDLRTPVASLKSMLETLSYQDPVSDDVKKELMTLSLKEVDYFEHLVEDLLFLAQTTEPRYKLVNGTVDLVELIESEIGNVEKAISKNEKKIALERDFQPSIKNVNGDPHLLRRLFRNAIDNAIYSAKEKVTIKLRNVGENFTECTIEDDGNGFTDEGLKEFGQRKTSRKLTSKSQGRVSIGLGSVIMNTVVLVHRGELHVANSTDIHGKIRGARIRIILPV